MKASEARVVHDRPELIQELEWQPRRLPGPSAELDSVDQILFTFYKGQLFRMLVNYDRRRTEGLTLDDMIEVFSAKYGPTTGRNAEIIFPSAYTKKVAVMGVQPHPFGLPAWFFPGCSVETAGCPGPNGCRRGSPVGRARSSAKRNRPPEEAARRRSCPARQGPAGE